MEPGAERVADPERAGLAGEDEEDGLEGVLGLVLVAERGAADAPDHRPVALDQQGEGRLARAVVRRVANRSRSGPSARSATAPTSKTSRSPRKTAPSVNLPTGMSPSGRVPRGYE